MSAGRSLFSAARELAREHASRKIVHLSCVSPGPRKSRRKGIFMPPSQTAAAKTKAAKPYTSQKTAEDKERDRMLDRIFAATCDDLFRMITDADCGKGIYRLRLPLPLPLVTALGHLRFLASTVVSAELAERIYGVPASALLAITMYDSGYHALHFAQDHGYEGPENSPDFLLAIERALMSEARHMASCNISLSNRKRLPFLA